MYPVPPHERYLYLPTYRYPYTVQLLDRLTAGATTVAGYLADDGGRLIDWQVVAQHLLAPERAILFAADQLRHLEVYGYLPPGHPCADSVIGYLAAITTLA